MTASCTNVLPTFTPPQIVSVNVQNPNMRVGDSTIIRLEVLASWGRTPIFYYKADRGRLVGLNGETGPQDGYVRASNQVRYYAPFTASAPGPNGYVPNDVIHIIAQDGQFITRQDAPVNISGSTVVFSSQQGDGSNGTLMIATDSGNGLQSAPQPLHDLANRELKGSSPAISPDGSRIAYVFYPGDGTSKIMMRDAAGQVLSLTNDARGLALDPSWSPDGNYLLYASTSGSSDGTFDIYEIAVSQAGGSGSTRLTNNNWDDRHPAWNPVPSAPDDRVIAVASKKNSLLSPGGTSQNWNVFLMDRKGNYTREISDVAGDGDNWAIEPSWRPDGNALAYTRFGPVNNFQSSAAKFQRIFVQELQQSSTLTPLNVSNTDPNSRESSPVWSTDQSNSIYFLRSDGNFQAGGRIFRTTYQPGTTSNAFPPQLVGPFQALYLPLSTVGGTNRSVQGYHPLDWR